MRKKERKNILKEAIINSSSILLKREIKRLEEKKKDILKEIKLANDEEYFKVGTQYTWHAKELFYKILPLDYIKTVFRTQRDAITPMINATLEKYILEKVIEHLNHNERESIVITIAVICETVISTPEGPVLVLEDPHKTVFSKPLKNTSVETANTWIGRLLIVNVKATKNILNEKNLEVSGIKVLKYTKHGIITSEGTEKTIPYTSGELFEHFEKHRGEKDCIKALDTIEHNLKKKNYYTLRESKTELRFRKSKLKEIIIFKEDKLQYIYEASKVVDRTEGYCLRSDSKEAREFFSYVFAPSEKYYHLY